MVFDARRDGFDQRQEGEVEEQHLVFGVVGDVDDLVGVQARVERVQHRARAGDRVVELHVAVAVPGERGDAVAGLDAQRRRARWPCGASARRVRGRSGGGCRPRHGARRSAARRGGARRARAAKRSAAAAASSGRARSSGFSCERIRRKAERRVRVEAQRIPNSGAVPALVGAAQTAAPCRLPILRNSPGYAACGGPASAPMAGAACFSGVGCQPTTASMTR